MLLWCRTFASLGARLPFAPTLPLRESEDSGHAGSKSPSLRSEDLNQGFIRSRSPHPHCLVRGAVEPGFEVADFLAAYDDLFVEILDHCDLEPAVGVDQDVFDRIDVDDVGAVDPEE